MTRIAIVGSGVVGASWALVFARAGLDVALHDPSPAVMDAALVRVAEAAAGLVALGMGGADAPDQVLARIRPVARLEDALAGADYVQENAPERVEVKRELYRTLDALTPPSAILASSTSGLPASSFTEGLAHRERCLVAHPINPPHLIPLVELVPAPWTDPAVMDRAAALMAQVGQSPVRLSREANGFLVNRLQGALLAEAFRLVEDGLCSVADVDKAIADGLGLRWFFMGPFETIDLNAPNGVAEYCRNFGGMYHALAKEQADPREWNPALVAAIETARRTAVPADALPARRDWRDRCLAALVAAKRRVRAEQGS